ncbi:P-loop containing nucleoside triphosphate hydrolase protein [Trichophaea hybrida]|nr:P-loop containing nucleoside triphosphate hydrolase protein [Trichophaea hybrida]
MTKIPMSSTRTPATQPDDRQRDSAPSPFTIVDEYSDSDSEADIGQSGNSSGGFRSATAEWLRKARDSISMKRVIMQIRDGCPIKFVAVMGLTGSGKSSAIRSLTGKDVFVEHGISAGTTSFAMYPAIIEGQYFVFIDTPGFNDSDSSRTDIAVFLDILGWFRQMSPYCNLAGILYVHDITPPRFSAAAKMNLDLLQALCGEEYFRNVTVLTTMWRKLSADSHEEAEGTQNELEEGPWKAMCEGGARVLQHLEGVVEPKENATDKRKIARLEEQRKKAKSELEEIVAYYKKSDNIVPQIQHEVRAKVDIFETKAGQVLKKIWFPTSEPPPMPPPPEEKSWWNSFVNALKWFCPGSWF